MASGPSPLLAASASAATNASVVPGVDLAFLDRSVRPGNDFYAYANGTWRKSAVIPADRSSTGVWLEVRTKVEDEVIALLQDAAAEKLRPSEQSAGARKAGAYFASYLDEAAVEERGVRPLSPLLAEIAALEDKRALSAALGRQLRADVDPLNLARMYTPHLFGLWVDRDLDDPARTTAFLLQGGLGMPDRSYYLDPSKEMTAHRQHYAEYLTRLFELAGIDAAAEKAKRVLALEVEIARVHATPTETEDVKLANNPWKREELARRAPGIDWDGYLGAAGLGQQKDIVIWQPHATIGISALVAKVPLATWKDYLVARVLDDSAESLPHGFVDAHFAFHDKELRGTPQLLSRAKRGVDRVGDEYALGDAVGRVYVARHFRAEDKRAIEDMAKGIIDAFRLRIEQLPWMAPQTKAKAEAKLATLYVGVGYPDHFEEYDGLEIARGDLLGNARRIEEWRYHRQLAKLGKPADPKEWVMAAQEVDAVNLPVRNALNFPAADLQPPYYRPGASAAANYGDAGATIGHEISHSFDNTGAAFDASGRFANWWTPEDLAHFRASCADLVAQYNAYRPLPDVAVDGEQTLGENLADLAGLAAAHDAWRASLGGKPAPMEGGLTGEQQFFVAYAQSWRTKFRDETLRSQLRTNGHAPDEQRALTVRNLDAWYPAFDVQPQDAQYLAPEQRVRVW